MTPFFTKGSLQGHYSYDLLETSENMLSWEVISKEQMYVSVYHIILFVFSVKIITLINYFKNIDSFWLQCVIMNTMDCIWLHAISKLYNDVKTHEISANRPT